MNQMKVPVPLLSFHIEPPWKSEVTKARRIGEMAKIKPMRMKGNRMLASYLDSDRKDVTPSGRHARAHP
jgi:hypothetical protein